MVGRSRKRKEKTPTDWKKIIIQYLVGVAVGLTVLLIEKLFF
jgi:hypothetical protein|nr:MAG TPA: hypothetical protein [Caudoviricetes sp.]